MLWSELKKEIDIPEETKDIFESLAFLIAERNRQGISQQDFAEKIGMTQAQLAKIEGATSVPTLKTLNRYAQGLGLKMILSFNPESNYTVNQ